MDRFIYITDPHYGATPLNRIDDYNSAILEKLEYVFKLAAKNNCIILCGGDICNSPRIKIYDINRLLHLFAKYRPNFYSICGNESHDGIGEASPITTLKTSGFIKNTSQCCCFPNTNIVFLDHGTDIEFSKFIVKNKINILMTHITLVKEPVIFDHILLKDFKTDFDIVTIGHYHPYQGVEKIGNTTFIAPGALARIKKVKHDIERTPKAVYIVVNDDGTFKTKEIEIPHSKDVWSKKESIVEESVFESAFIQNEVSDMKSIIDETETFMTLESAMSKFGEINNVDKKVVDFCTNSIGAM